MNRAGFLLFLGASLIAGGALTGCSSTSGGNGGSATTTTGTTSNSSTTTTAAPTLDCTSYCSVIMGNCTAANAQYTDATVCANVCAGFTAKGTLADMAGDTLGCRIYHAGAAAGSASNATTHCPHAGPTGGDKDPKGAAGICGEPCTSFCSIAAAVCTGANKQFADTPTCMTACQGFAASAATYSIADTSKNDMGCRFYHLSAASESATLAAMHCPHIVTASAVCVM